MIRCGHTVTVEGRWGPALRPACELSAVARVRETADPWPQQYRCDGHLAACVAGFTAPVVDRRTSRGFRSSPPGPVPMRRT